jgi:hypothetical protein
LGRGGITTFVPLTPFLFFFFVRQWDILDGLGLWEIRHRLWRRGLGGTTGGAHLIAPKEQGAISELLKDRSGGVQVAAAAQHPVRQTYAGRWEGSGLEYRWRGEDGGACHAGGVLLLDVNPCFDQMISHIGGGAVEFAGHAVYGFSDLISGHDEGLLLCGES